MIASLDCTFIHRVERTLTARDHDTMLAIRVRHGVKEDLIDLAARVPGVGRVRARLLVNAGYGTPQAIASAGIGVLVQQTGISPKIMAEIHAQCQAITAISEDNTSSQR